MCIRDSVGAGEEIEFEHDGGAKPHSRAEASCEGVLEGPLLDFRDRVLAPGFDLRMRMYAHAFTLPELRTQSRR